jgi:two-component system chemotaxis sensor kinase CheA
VKDGPRDSKQESKQESKQDSKHDSNRDGPQDGKQDRRQDRSGTGEGDSRDFDASAFLAGFIAEAEEHVVSANAHLLSLEAAAVGGRATPRQVRELFRSFHTIKGLAAMVGVEPIVDIAHAMETVLREADRASGRLPVGSFELLLQGVRAIEQRVGALSMERPVPAAPAALLEALNGLRPSVIDPAATVEVVSLPSELWSRLSAAEREQLVQGIKAGRRAVKVDFFPSLGRANLGITITVVRERVAEIAEIVKVIPQSVPATENAPGGLAFALLVLSDVPDEEIARAACTEPDAILSIVLRPQISQPMPIQAASRSGPLPGLGRELEQERELAREPEQGQPGDEERAGPEVRRGIVRVEVSRLDDALEKLAALVVTQFRLGRAVAAARENGGDVRVLAQVIGENGRHLRDLRASIMRARMVSVAELLERVPLIVRGLSRSTGKPARLEMKTGKAELDKAVADRIFPAVVQLVRNAVDHALESAEERRAGGKAEVGLVTVSCFERSDNQLELTVADDGRGVDGVRLAGRAGVPTPQSDDALLELMTRPGLSTKTEVTTTSGRGVGMDVVKRITVDELRGELSMVTTAGQGTTFTMRIPLSITIVDAFSFLCGGETFVVPVAMVEEIQELDGATLVRGPDRRRAPRDGRDRRRRSGGAAMIGRRGEAVPILRLDEVFGLPPAEAEKRDGQPVGQKVIIVRRHGEPFAFAVDRMLGQQEVVVRPLEDPLVKVDGVSGTTDLGDGRPTLVLDLASLGDKLGLPREGGVP